MTESNQARALLFTLPQQEEIEAAQRLCCGRSCSACETPAGFAWRKRAVDLSALVEMAVRRELTAGERRAVELHWYGGLSITETAAQLSVALPTASTTLQRAQRKIEQALYYAVQYQHDVASSALVPLAVRRALAVAAARHASPDTVGGRLRALREREALSPAAAAVQAGFYPARLAALECGRAQLRAEELLRLSAFYQVPMEWIMKGADQNDAIHAL